MKSFGICALIAAVAFAPAYAQGTGGNETNASNMSSNSSSMNESSGMPSGMANATGECGEQGTGNATNMTQGNMSNATSQGSGGSAYSMGVSKNETGQNATEEQNTTGPQGNDTGIGAGMGGAGGNSSDSGSPSSMDAGMQAGALTSSYSYDQKDQMIRDVKDQLKQLDIKIDAAKRHGENDTARSLTSQRDQLKKQLGELKKANKDTWESEQSKTMNMMKEMDLTE